MPAGPESLGVIASVRKQTSVGRRQASINGRTSHIDIMCLRAVNSWAVDLRHPGWLLSSREGAHREGGQPPGM